MAKLPTMDHAEILRLPIVTTEETASPLSCQVFIDPDELIRLGRLGHTLVISAPCRLNDVSVASGLAATSLRRTP